MSKRISKEELQSDPLIENYNRAAALYNQHKSTVISVIIGVFIVAGASIAYYLYSTAQEEQAQELMALAEIKYSQGDYEEALYGSEFELTYGFDQIVDEFPRTKAGNMARFFAAVASHKLGDINAALDYIDDFKVPSGILGVGPLTLHANLLFTDGQYEAAARKFIEAANWNKNDLTTPSNLLSASRAYYENGDFNRAEEIADQIINNYPASAQVIESQKLKGMIASK